MARIAILAAPHISLDSGVLRVCLRLCMTIRALKLGIVRRIGVAGRTDSVCISVRCWEPGVIECRASPAVRGMARFSGRWEACRRMHGVRRPGIV